MSPAIRCFENSLGEVGIITDFDFTLTLRVFLDDVQ